MKANKIEESKVYELKIGKNITTVKVVRIERRVNGQLAFVCENTNTHKLLTVTDVDRFVKAVKVKDEPAIETTNTVPTEVETAKTPKPPRVKEDGTMSGLNAAHKVLTEEGRAMNAREIYEAAVERGYCKLEGKTPILTVSAIIQIDIKKRGDESRFYKAGRGLFAAR
jgi:hypothetical protein